VIRKGSITINGISLTIKSVEQNIIAVAIIPYTHEFTNIHRWNIKERVNIEFDILGKYVISYMEKTNAR
jgi:riboflavin synthase